jgi:hypothetical protein
LRRQAKPEAIQRCLADVAYGSPQRHWRLGDDEGIVFKILEYKTIFMRVWPFRIFDGTSEAARCNRSRYGKDKFMFCYTGTIWTAASAEEGMSRSPLKFSQALTRLC